jgi:hypothetical protein
MTGTIQLSINAADMIGVDTKYQAQIAQMVANSNRAWQTRVSFTYAKQTDSAPRIGGQDYVILPGIKSDTFFGVVTRAFRTKAGALRFTVLTAARSDGKVDGWLTVIPAGITGLVVTGEAPAPRPAELGQEVQ